MSSNIIQATPVDRQKIYNDMQAKYFAMLKAEGKLAELNALKARHADSTPSIETAYATATMAFLAVKGHLTALVKFDDGTEVEFDAWPWGIGAGVLTGVGLYYGVDAYTLVGKCNYHCQWGADGGGALQISCWRDGVGALGQVNVAAAGAGVGETGGTDGNWTWA